MYTFTFEVQVPMNGANILLLNSAGYIMFSKLLINGSPTFRLHKETIETDQPISKVRYQYFLE